MNLYGLRRFPNIRTRTSTMTGRQQIYWNKNNCILSRVPRRFAHKKRLRLSEVRKGRRTAILRDRKGRKSVARAASGCCPPIAHIGEFHIKMDIIAPRQQQRLRRTMHRRHCFISPPRSEETLQIILTRFSDYRSFLLNNEKMTRRNLIRTINSDPTPLS